MHPLPKKSSEDAQDIQFYSVRGSKADQKVNLFAEQNAKQVKKEKQQARRRKKNIIIGAVVFGVIIIVGVVFILVTPSPEELFESPAQINEEKAQSLYQNAIDEIKRKIKSAPLDDEEIESTNSLFEESISLALSVENTAEADAMRVAQMLFYNSVSTDYHKIISIGESIQNIQALEKSQQLQYYNIMSNAYSAIGSDDLSIEYYLNASTISEELSNGGN